jgi:uncharacterized repeat protein (TIGR03803 family)
MKYLVLPLILLLLSTSPLQGQGGLWGMTSSGGPDGVGVIFKTNYDGTGQAVMHSFTSPTPGANPYSDLCQATLTNGKLYGMTTYGGMFDEGVLFEYDLATNTYSRKLDFNDTEKGSYPYGSLVQAVNGRLYGMTLGGGAFGQGVIFEYDPTTSSYTRKLNFNGTNGLYPSGSLIQATNGKLYGMSGGGASSYGIIFQYDPINSTYTKKLDFNGTEKGSYPKGSLMQAANGRLYGMTSNGGVSNNGVLFEYDPVTDTYTKKIDFNGAEKGTEPMGSLTQATNGKLYGMTTYGGIFDKGVLFEYDPATGTYTKKLDFNGSEKGRYSAGSLMQASNGKLYGMALGGEFSDGVVFEYDPATNAYTKKLDFNRSDNGNVPISGLAMADNGRLYGLSNRGGLNGLGVLFEFDPATTTYTKKIDFDGSDKGSLPGGSLLRALNGKFYGTTTGGGVDNYVVLFEYDPATNTYTKKQDFDYTMKGSNPSSLILAANGKLYGMTRYGGVNYLGVLFEYDPATNTYTKKLDFDGTNKGGFPYGSLIQAVNGKLYGMTNSGGANFDGVLFEYDLTSNTYTKKIDFDYLTKGAAPHGNLMRATNGKLYGMTSNGGANYRGVLFEYDLTTNAYTKKLDFDGASKGSYPIGSLTESPNGKLYGITSSGGSNDIGVLFEYNPATGVYTKKLDFNGLNGASGYGHAYFGDFGSLLVVKQTQTITFNSLPSKTVGDAPFAIIATASSGLPVSYISDNPLVATISGSTATIVGAGTANITASQGGSGYYNPAPPVSQALVVKQNQTITFSTLAAKTFGDAAFTLSASASSGLAVSYASSNPEVATVSGNTVTIVGAGTANITASQGGNANYNAAAEIVQPLSVSKANQTITFNALPSKAVGDAPFTLSATAISGLPVSYISDNQLVATISGSTVTIVGIGTANITASQGGNAYYNAATSVSQALVVIVKQAQTVTFAALAAKTFGDAPFALSATASSGLPVSYVSDNPLVATISGSTVTIVGAGTANITASQGGGANYNAAVDAVQTLTVAKKAQQIVFPALSDKTLGDAVFTLTATANSALPVTYTSTFDKVSINGSQVTLVKAGRVTITANQAGNTNFNAATSVEQNFCIKPAKPTVTISNANSEAPTLISSASSGNQWYLNGTAVNNGTGVTLIVTAAGVYKVQASADNCTSAFSADFPIIITGDLPQTSSIEVCISPNPVEGYVEVYGIQGELSGWALIDMSGREATLALEKSVDRYIAPASHLAKGIYVLRLQQENKTYQLKFVKN